MSVPAAALFELVHAEQERRQLSRQELGRMLSARFGLTADAWARRLRLAERAESVDLDLADQVLTELGLSLDDLPGEEPAAPAGTFLQAWCPGCREMALPDAEGCCVWCGEQTGAATVAEPEPPAEAPRWHVRKGEPEYGPTCACGGPKGKQSRRCAACRKAGGHRGPDRVRRHRAAAISEELLLEARELYLSGLSLRQVAARVFDRTTYASEATCHECLHGLFRRRGWPLRDRAVVTAARNYRHGQGGRGRDESVYRRFLRERGEGWQGAYRPTCEGERARGGRCSRPAMKGSAYCYQHEPANRGAIEDHLVSMRARAQTQPFGPGEAHVMAKLTETQVPRDPGASAGQPRRARRRVRRQQVDGGQHPQGQGLAAPARRGGRRMSDRRFWIALAALLLVIGALVGWGTRAALGAPSLADPNEYLQRHGLSAPPTPFALVPADDPYLLAAGDFGIAGAVTGLYVPPRGACSPDGSPPSELCPDGGRYFPPGIRVMDGQEPVDLAYDAAHEHGHAVSWQHFMGDRDCDDQPLACVRWFVVRHEEALVDAWALHHLPGFWRWLTGRPMSAQTIENVRRNPGYLESGRWLRAAVAATGAPRWSRAVREQLGRWMVTSLEERVVLLERWAP